MFARCTILQADPDMADQAIKIVEERVVPWARELEGFQGLLEFLDRDTGKGMTLTLWDSEESRQASVERANEIRSAVAEEMEATIVGVENYELILDTR